LLLNETLERERERERERKRERLWSMHAHTRALPGCFPCSARALLCVRCRGSSQTVHECVACIRVKLGVLVMAACKFVIYIYFFLILPYT